MKIRQGFVSNSSTSSFITVGVLLSVKKYPLMKVLDKLFPGEDKGDDPDDWAFDAAYNKGYRIQESDSDNTIPDGKLLVGFDITTLSSSDMSECFEVSAPFSELEIKLNDVLDKLGVDKKENPPRIIMGSEAG